jgi:hypothetical protein
MLQVFCVLTAGAGGYHPIESKSLCYVSPKGNYSETEMEDVLGERRGHVTGNGAEKWSRVCRFTGNDVRIYSRITMVILSFDQQWYFWRVNKWSCRIPAVQVGFVVGISIIYLCMAFEETARLMSMMLMASHGPQVFSLS